MVWLGQEGRAFAAFPALMFNDQKIFHPLRNERGVAGAIKAQRAQLTEAADIALDVLGAFAADDILDVSVKPLRQTGEDWPFVSADGMDLEASKPRSLEASKPRRSACFLTSWAN